MDKKFLMSSLLTGSQMPMFDLRIAAHDEIERLEAQRDALLEALRDIDAVAVDFGHYESAARTMKEIAGKALGHA